MLARMISKYSTRVSNHPIIAFECYVIFICTEFMGIKNAVVPERSVGSFLILPHFIDLRRVSEVLPIRNPQYSNALAAEAQW